MILNAVPDPERGNVEVWAELLDLFASDGDTHADGEWRCRVLSRPRAEHERAMGATLYLSHHATCPDAAKWRRRWR